MDIAGSPGVFPLLLTQALKSVCTIGSLPLATSTQASRYFGSRLTFWTDPNLLTLRLHNRVGDGRYEFSLSERFLDRSDWTDVMELETALPQSQEMFQLVHWRDAYPEMPAFRYLVDRARKQRPVRRYGVLLTTEDMVREYFGHYLKLISNIEKVGFRDRNSLGAYEVPYGGGLHRRLSFHKRNIGVAISADGRLLRFLGGRHRTAIAQALGLPSVPVELRLIHADWLATEVSRTGLPPVPALLQWLGARGGCG